MARKHVTAPPAPLPTPEEIRERAAIERENSLKEKQLKGIPIDNGSYAVHVYTLRLPQ